MTPEEVVDEYIRRVVARVFEVNADGKITLWRGYFDMETTNAQFAAIAG